VHSSWLNRLFFSLTLVASSVLAPLVPAHAATTYTVQAGGSDETGGIEVTAFMPDVVQIQPGDTVTWNIVGFHNVQFLAGQPRPALVIPDPDNPSQLILNPEIAFPVGGNVFDGSSMVNSGIPMEEGSGPPQPVPYSLTFPKAGTYAYICAVHPEMAGVVLVRDEQPPMTPDQVASAIPGLQKDYVGSVQAKEAAMSNIPTTTIMAGVKGTKAESLHFTPNRVTINVGDTLTWTVDTQDPHTVTFLSGGPPVEFFLPEPQASGPPKLVLNPMAIRPAGGSTYNGTGYTNSGFLSAYPTAPGAPPPNTYSLTFTRPGTYSYYCIIHGPIMSGTVVVTGTAGAAAAPAAPSAQMPAAQMPTGK